MVEKKTLKEVIKNEYDYSNVSPNIESISKLIVFCEENINSYKN